MAGGVRLGLQLGRPGCQISRAACRRTARIATVITRWTAVVGPNRFARSPHLAHGTRRCSARRPVAGRQSSRPHEAPRNRDVEPGRVWSADQLDAFLSAAQRHRLFAFYCVAASTGAGRGELRYLRWHAVDLDTAEVTFGRSTAVVRGQRIEGTTKGGGGLAARHPDGMPASTNSKTTGTAIRQPRSSS